MKLQIIEIVFKINIDSIAEINLHIISSNYCIIILP